MSQQEEIKHELLAANDTILRVISKLEENLYAESLSLEERLEISALTNFLYNINQRVSLANIDEDHSENLLYNTRQLIHKLDQLNDLATIDHGNFSEVSSQIRSICPLWPFC